MKKDGSFEGPDWRGTGYFGWPEPKKGGNVLSGSIWHFCAIAVDAAKKGNFEAASQLVGWEEHASTDLSHFVWCELLGDIAPTSCFENLERSLAREDDVSRALDYCSAIYQRGLLSDAATLLRAFVRLYMPEAKDNPDIIGDYIADLLGDDLSDYEDCESINDYVEYVTVRMEEIEVQLGTVDVPIWQGDVLRVSSVAKTMLERLRRGHLLQRHRQKFEAMTGINCSRFYVDQTLQPLSAFAVLEEFMNSDAPSQFKTGVRYFFGHRIP